MFIAKELSELVGRTPMLELARLYPNAPTRILAKLERCNITSIKDRAAFSMMQDAIRNGMVGPDTVFVEATSGNSGIAIASLASALGYKSRLYMSELCSIERQKIMCAFGATVVLTPAAEHTRGARDRALAYCAENPDTAYFISQHTNPANGDAHYRSTGPEIWEQTGGDVAAVVIGLGTCGTLDGLARFFKEKNPNIRIVGVEPAASPVFSGGPNGEHHINGIGPGLVTENFKRVQDKVDEILLVSDEDAFEWARRATRAEGVIVGPTSGATLWGAAELAKREEYEGKTVVCFFYDTGERYLSVDGLFDTDGVDRSAL